MDAPPISVPASIPAVSDRLRVGGVAAPAAPAAAAGDAGAFANVLGDALKSVSQSQQHAADLQRRFQAGAEGASLEETMIAMQKAQIGFQAALAVRARLVSAYSDVMNMQV